MPLLNPTLRDPGPTPGSAAHWTITSRCAAQRLAAFGPAPSRAVEDFERWWTFAPAFGEGSLVLALFDAVPRGYEAFDRCTSGTFLDSLPEVLLERCSFGGAGVDSFEGWPSTPWLARWADVAAVAALFDGGDVEAFEGWSDSPSPAWAAAAFDAGAAAAEGFAGSWPVMKTL
jgi:hypothetical protein